MTRGVSTTLPTELPARFRAGFPWALDRRCKAVRDVSADMVDLWQDLGGFESLSTQRRILVERVVFLRRRAIEYETAIMNGKTPPIDAGTYTNVCNVLVGYVKNLGLERKPRLVGQHDYIGAAT